MRGKKYQQIASWNDEGTIRTTPHKEKLDERLVGAIKNTGALEGSPGKCPIKQPAMR